MILVYLGGGLGNQLFQYAAGRALAERHQAALKLVTRRFNKSVEKRTFRLHHYNIDATVATFREEWQVRWSNPFRYLRPHHQCPSIVQRDFRFDPEVLSAPDDVCLVGYWQSERYFLGVEQKLRHELTPRQYLTGKNLDMSNRIRQANAVSLHIRRGDYVSDPVTSAYHGCCSIDYYHEAVDQMARRVDSPHFFVFSDEINWALLHLQTSYPTTFVTHNGEEQDYEDLRLMSLCQHHIIANSSFSWWGAWLGKNPRKITIAPRDWSGGAKHDTRDLIPDSWIRI